MVIGIIFAVMGLLSIVAGNMGGLLTLAIAALIIFQGVHNFGGWEALTWDFKKRIRLLDK